MSLKTPLLVSSLLGFLGTLGAYFFYGFSVFLWFAVGTGLALLNVGLAAFSVSIALSSAKRKSVFIGLLLLKSLTFFVLVAVILIFLKPLLLPFTLGISVIIVGATVSALWKAREFFLRRSTGSTEK